MRALTCLLLMLPALVACRQEPAPGASEERASLHLLSDAFEPEGFIPAKYTCTGESISPPLAWGEAPAGTKSLVLIVEKLDEPRTAEAAAPHDPVLWMVFNIPPEATALQEGLGTEGTAGRDSRRFMEGRNHQGTAGYTGPCPSAGAPARYAFRLYALDVVLPSDAGLTTQRLVQGMTGHILAEGELIGAYHY